MTETFKPPIDLNVKTPNVESTLAATTGVQSGNRSEVLIKIRKGLPFSAIEALKIALKANQSKVASLLSISTSTLSRRKKAGHFLSIESEKIVRLALLKDNALSMMQDDEDAAIRWLWTPLPILDGASPIEHASTEVGASEVRDLIGRISHGVFC